MDVMDLKKMTGQLAADPQIVEVLDALIEEIGRLQDSVATLERVRAYNERG